MKLNLLIKRLTLSLIAFSIVTISTYSQVKEVLYYVSADATLGNGTGQPVGDLKSRNLGADGNFQICNFDDYSKALMSYFEGWMKFDLTTLEDSIPEGHEILFAEVKTKIATNDGKQGYKVYHIYDADDWLEGNGTYNQLSTEGGITWDNAQAYDYENPDNYAFVSEDYYPGEINGRPTVNVTAPVLYELGEQGNKILTLRFAPYHTEYDPDAGLDKRWIGLYSRESSYDLPEDAEFNPNCAQLTLWIGPAQPTIFSDLGDFGDINNYVTSPDKYGYWIVEEDEGDERLQLASRPAPIEGTPGGLAIYDLESYTDFDLSVSAKSSFFAESNKADFAVIFGYQDPYNYSYAYFIGNDDGGLYNVKDTLKTLISAQETPAIVDTSYHTYRLTREGNVVTVYIDDTEYMSFEDVALGGEGKIGLASYNDVAIFDDFSEGELETDFSELLATIAIAQSIVDTATVGTENGQYTQDAVDALQDSIDVAQAVADNSSADQATVNSANDALLASIDAFVKSVNGLYTTELAELIENTEAKIDTSVAGTGVGEYPEDAITVFQGAIDSAKTVLASTEVTQNDIDAAVAYLQAAETTFDSQLITTGIKKYENTGFAMYPNPSNGRLTIESESDIQKITIVNLLGQSVLTQNNVQTRKVYIDLSGMNTGVYFVTCHLANGNKNISRLVKK